MCTGCRQYRPTDGLALRVSCFGWRLGSHMVQFCIHQMNYCDDFVMLKHCHAYYYCYCRLLLTPSLPMAPDISGTAKKFDVIVPDKSDHCTRCIGAWPYKYFISDTYSEVGLMLGYFFRIVIGKVCAL